ncbi:hypothetical protein [Nocardiopsis sp. CNR-923]|uniref:hypothetical protein n=1 Tax=Nocardiopsis sp. CNR-923 TaxID=1904965 RepID=UPI0013016EC1|nr:hypothetical protein [Nocardiopsis sp. CNR-923]
MDALSDRDANLRDRGPDATNKVDETTPRSRDTDDNGTTDRSPDSRTAAAVTDSTNNTDTTDSGSDDSANTNTANDSSSQDPPLADADNGDNGSDSRGTGSTDDQGNGSGLGARPADSGSHPGPGTPPVDPTPEQRMQVAYDQISHGAVTFSDNVEAARYGANYWNDYADKLPPNQRESLFNYTSDPPHSPNYEEINGHLRSGTPPAPGVFGRHLTH